MKARTGSTVAVLGDYPAVAYMLQLGIGEPLKVQSQRYITFKTFLWGQLVVDPLKLKVSRQQLQRRDLLNGVRIDHMRLSFTVKNLLTVDTKPCV